MIMLVKLAHMAFQQLLVCTLMIEQMLRCLAKFSIIEPVITIIYLTFGPISSYRVFSEKVLQKVSENGLLCP